jgi:hypothetical protein
MSAKTSLQSDFERQIEFDFLRATEVAALKTLQWLGKGDKENAGERAHFANCLCFSASQVLLWLRYVSVRDPRA